MFIIAELSANHNGSLETALQTIRAAKRAGVDGIKLKTYKAKYSIKKLVLIFFVAKIQNKSQCV